MESLVEASDLIIIGEYMDDSEQILEYEYSGQFGKEILVDTISTNTIRVKKVLKGNSSADEIKMSQRYGIVDNKKLITFSKMTPMKKGDTWLMFLTYDDFNNTYWSTGDYSGRYPASNSDMKSLIENAARTINERENWLSNLKRIDFEDVEKYIANEQIVYTSSNGTNYLIEKDSDREKMLEYTSEISAYAEEINPAVFGVYDSGAINLKLYCLWKYSRKDRTK